MNAWDKLNSGPRAKSSLRWHHTVDKLPMFREEVLVYRKDKRVTTAYLELSSEGQVRWVDIPDEDCIKKFMPLLDVSHWLEFDGKPQSIIGDKLRRFTGDYETDDSETE